MTELGSQAALFAAWLYNGDEWDWVELHRLASGRGTTDDGVTVGEAARFLCEHPRYSTGLVNKIRKLEAGFKRELYWVDACPSQSGGIYLRNGNKRSIAYAMRLVKGGDAFRAVPIRDWRPEYTDLDLENLQGLPTTDDPVI